jgi:BirA family biotin operon repressor/biotin-[acetyl-CoA-carboxylase] ligase
MTPISVSRIAAGCAPVAGQVAIRIVESTGSTNADLLGELGSLDMPTLLVALEQTAGRGRAGRSWLSAPGRSLTFSLAWKFPLPVHALVGLPLVVGVALAEALAAFDVHATLKWPNDVLCDGRKLAGILIETAKHSPEASWAVTGIGLNLTLDEVMQARIGQPAAHLPQLAGADPNRLLAAILNRLSEAMMEFGQHGLPAFVERWNALHAHAGQAVSILDQERVVHEGTAVGIDWIGRLLLDTGRGTIAVMAGDVSLRSRGGQ